MPKVAIPLDGSNNPQLRPAIDEIQNIINHIEFVLEGRVDNENIWKEGDKTMAFSASKVNDYAINTKPITAAKFFSNFTNEESPYDKFQTLLSNVNDEYRVLQGTGSIIVNKDNYSENALTTYIEIEHPANYKLVNLEDYINNQLFENNFTVNVVFGDTAIFKSDKDSFYTPHVIGDKYVITYDFFLDRFESYLGIFSKLNSFDLFIVSTSKEKLTLRADVKTYGELEKDEFVTLVLNAYVLFKEII